MPEGALDHDQAALDAPRHQAVERRTENNRSSAESAIASRHVYASGEPERVAYGQAEIEWLAIYRTGPAPAPVFVFIEGGAWLSRSKYFATPAEGFLAAGAHYVLSDFAWVRDASGLELSVRHCGARPVRPFSVQSETFTSLDHVAKTTRATGL